MFCTQIMKMAFCAEKTRFRLDFFKVKKQETIFKIVAKFKKNMV